MDWPPLWTFQRNCSPSFPSGCLMQMIFQTEKKSFSKDDNQTHDTRKRRTQRGSSWEADADGGLVGDPGSKCDACGLTHMPRERGLLIRPDTSCVGVSLLWIPKHAQMLGPAPASKLCAYGPHAGLVCQTELGNLDLWFFKETHLWNEDVF